jgi:hypothetical protein
MFGPCKDLISYCFPVQSNIVKGVYDCLIKSCTVNWNSLFSCVNDKFIIEKVNKYGKNGNISQQWWQKNGLDKSHAIDFL